jgi:hypothetical protein
MQAHAHIRVSPTRSHPPPAWVFDHQNFEALFRIPVTHRLLVVRWRSRGGLWSGVYWEHEEYDPQGGKIARYESFAESHQAGVRRSGWRKYDPAGRLVEEGEWPA